MKKKVLLLVLFVLGAVACKKNAEPTQTEQDTIAISADILSAQENPTEIIKETLISEIEQKAINDFDRRTSDLAQSGIDLYRTNNSLAEEEPLSAEEVEVNIVKTYTGDLSGDGLEDIVIWYDVREINGRHPLESGVLLYRNTGNNIEFIKKHSGGGLDGYSNVEIRNGKVILSWMEHRESDPYCCPTKKQTESIVIAQQSNHNETVAVAIKFINTYTDTYEIPNNLVTDNFSKLYKKWRSSDFIEYDRIVNGQDNGTKYKLSKILKIEGDSAYLLLTATQDWVGYKITIKVTKVNGKWLVDGSGDLNIPKNLVAKN